VVPQVVAAAAFETENAEVATATVRVTFALDEQPAVVFYLASAPGSTVAAATILGASKNLASSDIVLSSIPRGASLYLVARDPSGNVGDVREVEVDDSVAPRISGLSAVQVRNDGVALVRVRVEFQVDEAPSTVYWIASSSTPSASAVVDARVALASPVELPGVARGHALFLVAVDEADNFASTPVRIDVVDLVRPALASLDAVQTANAAKSAVDVRVVFSVDEEPNEVFAFTAAPGAAPSATSVLGGVRVLSGATLPTVARGHSVYLVARDGADNVGDVVELPVRDVVPTRVLAARAVQVSNDDASTVRVALTFDVDETPSEVFWVAALDNVAPRSATDVVLLGSVADSGDELSGLPRGAHLWLAARDTQGNVGALVKVVVTDGVAPEIVSASAREVSNIALDRVSVQLTFVVDEVPSTVHWIAGARGASVSTAEVLAGAAVVSGATLPSVPRGNSLYLVAVDADDNAGEVVEVEVLDVVAPKVLTSSAVQTANALLDRVDVRVNFALDENTAHAFFLSSTTVPSVDHVVTAGVRFTSGDVFASLDRTAVAYVVAVDNVAQRSALTTLVVSDPVAPAITSAEAHQESNEGASSVNVRVIFAVDESRASVFWLAALSSAGVTRDGVIADGVAVTSGQLLVAVARGAHLFLAPVDPAGNRGVLEEVVVTDSVAPTISDAAASQVANVALGAASVRVTYSINEAPSTVFWLASSTVPIAAVVRSAAQELTSSTVLPSISRTHSIYLVAVDPDDNSGVVVSVGVEDKVAPRIVSSSAVEVSNFNATHVLARVQFALDEAPARVFWVQGASAPSSASALVAEGGAQLASGDIVHVARGARVFLVAQDAAGNYGNVESLTVQDSVAPALSALAASQVANVLVGATSVRVEFASDEPVSVFCLAVDGAAPDKATVFSSGVVLPASPTVLPVVARGASVYLVARDTSGNEGVLHTVAVVDVV
jgi:hypothetical protein